MLRKTLKIVGIILLLLVIALFAVPFIFEDQIKAKIAEAINKKVDAEVSFADADLSLFQSFPKANVTVEKLLILNKAPFKGDTLVSLGAISLDMSIAELFKGKEEPINIDAFSSENGVINILFNKDGLNNFDIAVKEAAEEKEGESSPLALNINEYSVRNFRFKYYDDRSKVKFEIDSLNHKGTGDFAASKLDLTTNTTARISVDMDKTNYINKMPLSLDAVLGIDLSTNTYTFKDNNAVLNQLPLKFDGSLQLLDEGQHYDLTFKTPSSGFQNFLALVPSSYSGSLKDVSTTGDFVFEGFVKGLLSDATIPKFNVKIASQNASFKYPNLPKSVQNIVIDTKIINETGRSADTYVNIDKLSFKIDRDTFDAKAHIGNLTENPTVDAALKGTINLGNISAAYPIKLDKPLAGVLKADVTTKFDMESVEQGRYERINNAGTASLSQFKYVDENGKAMNISEAAVQFNPQTVTLQKFSASTGKTDMGITGTISNFYGFLFSDKNLEGRFALKSNQFAVSDFMTEEPADQKNKTSTKQEAIKIPAFLDCTIDAVMATVLYDNLVLKNASGRLKVKDQRVTLENVKTSIFGGSITANGSVSTRETIPVFDMALNLSQVNIQDSFTQLDMLKSIAPLAGVVNGRLNSTIKVSGNLDAKELTPELSSIDGELFGQLLSTTVNASNSKLLNTLASNIKFIDVGKINLNDLKAALTFDNGKVTVKPIDLKYQDIKITVGGQHGFDQTMAYNLSFDVPAKYLGSEANKLMATLTPAEAAKLKNIPITASLTGNFSSPKVTTDIQKSVSHLATQLVQIQKDRLINQGTNALGNLLGGNKKDSTKPASTDAIKTKAENVIKDLFNKKKK